MDFSSAESLEAEEMKINLGKVLNVAATIVPALQPVAAVVAALKK